MADSGIAVSAETFDLQVDDTGDLKATVDGQELVKDLSLLIKLYFENQVTGSVLTPNRLDNIETRLSDLLRNDERVEYVNNVTVNPTGSGTISTVDVRLRTIYGLSEFDVEPNN